MTNSVIETFRFVKCTLLTALFIYLELRKQRETNKNKFSTVNNHIIQEQ